MHSSISKFTLLAILASILALTSAGSRQATQTSLYSHASSGTSTWSTNPKTNPSILSSRLFGRRKHRANKLSRDATAMMAYEDRDEVGAEWEAETSSALQAEHTASSTEDMKMGQASARAAFVACVSAAAIGGARHALELVCA